jgi:hypothetical protein
LLPEWWGVVEVSVNGHVAFEQIRPARQNSELDPETLVRLLWRSEVQSALVQLGVEVPASATRGTMWRLLLARAEIRELRGVVRCALRHRNGADARIPSRRFRQEVLNDVN